MAWAIVVVALIAVIVKALGGSSGARAFLKGLGVVVLVIVAGIAAFLYNNKRESQRRAEDRSRREASCRAPATSECLYRELTQAQSRISAAIALLRSAHDTMTPAITKSLLDPVLNDNGFITISGDNSRKVLAYSLPPKCEAEKKFSFLINVGFASDERSATYLNTWWQDAEDGYREWASCVAKPDHVTYSNFDPQLSMDFSRLPKTVKAAPTVTNHRRGTLSETDDPCAVGISKDERLRRLRKHGPVRQTGNEDYSAGGHTVTLFRGELIYCK
jgi:hypothetical protein